MYKIIFTKDSPLRPIMLIKNIGKVSEISKNIFIFQLVNSNCKMENIIKNQIV